MRYFVSVVATAVTILAAGAASASLVFTVSGFNDTQATSDLTLTNNGDQITLTISLENTNGDGIAAFEAAVFGAGTYSAVSGSTTGRALSTVLGGVVYSGGIDNSTAGSANGADTFGSPLPRTLSDADLTGGGTQIKWFGGLSAATVSPTADGSQDLGIGGQTGLGNAHAVVTFTINGLTDANAVTLIGAGAIGLGAVIGGDGSDVTGQVVNGSIQIGAPIPEPGTALLMGLGLTGLSLAGRRRK